LLIFSTAIVAPLLGRTFNFYTGPGVSHRNATAFRAQPLATFSRPCRGDFLKYPLVDAHGSNFFVSFVSLWFKIPEYTLIFEQIINRE
jgi:hypothetical protein